MLVAHESLSGGRVLGQCSEASAVGSGLDITVFGGVMMHCDTLFLWWQSIVFQHVDDR